MVSRLVRSIRSAEQLDGDYRCGHPANQRSQPQGAHRERRSSEAPEKDHEDQYGARQTIESPPPLLAREEEPDKDR